MQVPDESKDLFTPEFKYYKAKNPPPDLSNVVDLLAERNHLDNICCISPHPTDLKPIAGLKPCHEWKVYQFSQYPVMSLFMIIIEVFRRLSSKALVFCTWVQGSNPGFFIIPNPFMEKYQYYWISRCLQDFPSDKSNETNLSALGAEKGCNFWTSFVGENCQSISKDDPLRQLRWTTLGYHYNWTSKDYSEDNKAEFPQDVNCLAQYLAASLGFKHYKSEAAIINYYHTDSTLAGHTDHSEFDHSAPLFSISFGQTAVFLLGGKTKSVQPMAVYVRSGDICIMSGESRLAYHAVPKILSSSLPAIYSTASKTSSISQISDVCSKHIVAPHAHIPNSDIQELSYKHEQNEKQLELSIQVPMSASRSILFQPTREMDQIVFSLGMDDLSI
ncbi:alkylated DNA repair protein alkB 1 [Biomphalaria pfeifferi]|uniref:Alkylated DNA repair protein alkB 1 n=1 Tax=Biomphalaria pfeifferi TaxID=112525 RepID=A0AAD8FE36_BIOPF|nr:alkylated DNA repair protein alkB 1 [Biomphalaria pfeifferi]